MLNPTEPINNATRLNLQRLMMIRLVIIVSLTLVIFSLQQASIPIHASPLLAAIGALVVMNGAAWLHIQATQNTHERILFSHLVGDLLAFSCLFYFSGGYSNPFIWMYLLPITVAAVALQPVYAWIIALISISCYTLLMFFHVPLSHLHVHAGGVFNNAIKLDIHLVGMWLGFVVSAIIIAIFIARIGKNLRDYDQKIADVREKTLESERLLALGTQAASAAHELGTPLATMNIINKDLMLEHAAHAELSSQLNTMQTQIKRCKEILSTLTQDAGLSRADLINTIDLTSFIQQAIARWQETRPATALTVNMQDNGENPTILLDTTLTRAILNVLDNAADAADERVLLEAHWDKKYLSISVRDFGKGLSEDASAKIGLPFFTQKKHQGMGLGVYLTQLTLAKYEGKLTINNHSEGGAQSIIKLPMAKLIVKAE